MTTPQPPRYSELPELGALGVRHSWGHLPNALGTLSLVSSEAIVSAARTVAVGETVGLNLPLDAFDPPLFGRSTLSHRIEGERNEFEDVLDGFNPQSSSQLDGLGHVRARELGFYGGIEQEDVAEALGMQHWAERGIAARGVLLDVAARRERLGQPSDPFDDWRVEPAELLATAAEQQVAIRRGDVVLVRTGWSGEMLRRQAAGDPTEDGRARWAGLVAHEGMAEYLWDAGIAALGSDNPAVENGPGTREHGSLHRRLLPALGMPLFELLRLDPLAARCGSLGRWEFLFVSAPLALRGGLSSTANAVAIL